MRHLIALSFLVAGIVAYAMGMGPLFFGAPVLGSVLVAVGVMFEMAFWRRVMRPVRH